MRIWILGILWIFMVSNAGAFNFLNRNSTHFGLTPDCQLVVGKPVDFKKKMNDAASGTEGDCKNAQVLHFFGGDTSNLMVFIPTPADPKETTLYKGMKAYGVKLTDSLLNDTSTDIKSEFEVINYGYALPEKCGFDPKNFKVGIDLNVIYMLVTCENHLSFLRAQINFQRAIIFTPATWLVHFDKIPATKKTTGSKCVADQIAFIPYHGDMAAAADSYVLRYCNKLYDDKMLYSYATPLHNIKGEVLAEVGAQVPLPSAVQAEKNVENLVFMTSQLYVMKLNQTAFYIGTVDDRDIEDPSDFMLQQQSLDSESQGFFVFDSPVVMIGREYIREGKTFVRGASEGEWIIRAKQDPELQPGMDATLSCDYDGELKKLNDCKEDIKSVETINIILYVLLGFEILMIFATIGIFAFCIFTQRKRRRLHREKKALKRGGRHGHGKHGKKKHKKDKVEIESDTDKDGGGGGKSTDGKSTERTSNKEKKSKKDTTDNNNETDKKSTSFYTLPSQFQDKKTE